MGNRKKRCATIQGRIIKAVISISNAAAIPLSAARTDENITPVATVIRKNTLLDRFSGFLVKTNIPIDKKAKEMIDRVTVSRF